MELTQLQKDKLILYYRAKCIDETRFTNYLKREAIKNFNTTVISILDNLLRNNNKYSKKAVERYFELKFFDSEWTIDRKINQLISRQVFGYDEARQFFFIPDEVMESIVGKTEPEKEVSTEEATETTQNDSQGS